MMDNFDKISIGPEEYLIPRISGRVNKKFQSTKQQLHNMLETLFPTDVKDLLQSLCEAYFNQEAGDPYISLKEEDQQHRYVEILLESHVITRHPHDESKIRLSNFFQ